VLYAVGALFAVLLALIAHWQRRIDGQVRARVLQEISEAKARGADKPVAQHPIIEPLLCIGCGSCVRACPEDGVLGMVGGIAHVIQVSKCIGHARCEQVCPVGALTVGIGDVTGRSDLPRLTEEFETTVPGIFVAGELGGLALIRNAIEQGIAAIETIAARNGKGTDPVPDVLIVGAGPAGLAATLKAIELGLSYVTIDQNDLGGTVRKYPRRKLVMTQPVTLPLHGRLRRTEYRKEELIELWEGICARHGVQVQSGVRFLGAARGQRGFVARTSAGEIGARSILLALGRRGTPRQLGVPGEQQERVLYQLMDAATYNDQRLLVVGGGDSAVEAALALTEQRGNEVTLSYRKENFFRLKSRNEERLQRTAAQGRLRLLLSSEVREFGSDEAMLVARGRELRIPNDYAFVFAGGEPPYPLLRDLGVHFWSEAS